MQLYHFRRLYTVTPHVGVWIETIVQPIQSSSSVVTPHVGVWIETYRMIIWKGNTQSHLM